MGEAAPAEHDRHPGPTVRAARSSPPASARRRPATTCPGRRAIRRPAGRPRGARAGTVDLAPLIRHRDRVTRLEQHQAGRGAGLLKPARERLRLQDGAAIVVAAVRTRVAARIRAASDRTERAAKAASVGPASRSIFARMPGGKQRIGRAEVVEARDQDEPAQGRLVERRHRAGDRAAARAAQDDPAGIDLRAGAENASAGPDGVLGAGAAEIRRPVGSAVARLGNRGGDEASRGEALEGRRARRPRRPGAPAPGGRGPAGRRGRGHAGRAPQRRSRCPCPRRRTAAASAARRAGPALFRPCFAC